MTIDWWTLGLQAVNVAVLIWLLARFFWHPVAAMIEQRRQAAAAILNDAEAIKTEAARQAAAIAAERAGIAAEREALLAEARRAAEDEGRRLRDETAKEIAAARAAGRDQIDKEAQAVRATWATQAGRLALGIAARLTGRLPQAPLFDAFLTGLADAARALPDEIRAGTTGAVITVAGTVPLDAAAQDRCRAALAAALGTDADFAFEVEPALIGGLEARGPHFVISNNWRADLARIEAELDHDHA